MAYLLIWLFFGIFSALLASNKNRNVLGWFFIGFIFGPFGLLFAFFMKDGKDIIEEKNNLKEKQKTGDITLSEDIYHYEIRPKEGVKTEDEWYKVKVILFKFLNGNYKIKQNDDEIIYMEVSKSAYIKMSKVKKKNEKGSLKLLFKIDSIKCGNINFGNDIEVIHTEKEEKLLKTSTIGKTDKLIKLSEMLDKKLITEEEFKIQKKALLN